MDNTLDKLLQHNGRKVVTSLIFHRLFVVQEQLQLLQLIHLTNELEKLPVLNFSFTPYWQPERHDHFR